MSLSGPLPSDLGAIALCLAATSGDAEVSRPFAVALAACLLVRGKEPLSPGIGSDHEPRPHGNLGRSVPDKSGNLRRDRTWGVRRLQEYTDKAFRRRFKVSRERFWKLVELLRPHLEPDDMGVKMATVSSGSHVPAECQLAATLRYLSGACKMDAEDLFGIAHTTFYVSLWKVVYALHSLCQVPFDPYDEATLTDLAAAMYDRSGGLIKGCVGAIDGMALKIKKPSKLDEANQVNYMNRKGFYSINFQGLADAHRRIIYYDMGTQGSTHDSLAFTVSSLGMKLQERPLPAGFWIAGDEAYVNSDWLLTPYGKALASSDTYKDNFNFYLSRCRINVECAFGMLVWRFGILRRPIGCSLEHTTKLVAVCVMLHNMAIDDNVGLHEPLKKDMHPMDSYEPIRQDRVTYVERGLLKNQSVAKREAITKELRALGRARPAHKRQRVSQV